MKLNVWSRGYVNEWQEMDNDDDREQFETALRRASEDGDDKSTAALRQIRALKGESLSLTVGQVRTLQHMAHQASKTNKPVRLTAAALEQLCEAWLAAHVMHGGDLPK